MPGTMADIPPQLQHPNRLDAQGVHGVNLTALRDSSTNSIRSKEPLSSIQKLRLDPIFIQGSTSHLPLKG